MFFPLAQNPNNELTLVVRSERPQAEIAAALSSMMAQADSALPVVIESWPDAMALVLFPMRAATVALGVLGLMAIMLSRRDCGSWGFAWRWARNGSRCCARPWDERWCC